MKSALIPENKEGKQNDLTCSQSFNSQEAAQNCFKKACERLLHPELWHELTGILSATFKTYSDKILKNGPVQKGDFIKIDIPGIGTQKGNGYDWVKVTALVDGSNLSTEESFAMKLQPSSNPLSNDNSIAHFFSDKASSTFLIHRENNTVIASYHGRNEISNSDTDNLIDNIRNTIIATGAFLGLSEAQWSSLLKAFLKD